MRGSGKALAKLRTERNKLRSEMRKAKKAAQGTPLLETFISSCDNIRSKPKWEVSPDSWLKKLIRSVLGTSGSLHHRYWMKISKLCWFRLPVDTDESSSPVYTAATPKTITNLNGYLMSLLQIWSLMRNQFPKKNSNQSLLSYTHSPPLTHSTRSHMWYSSGVTCGQLHV